MSEFFDSQNQTSSNIRNLLQERIDKANPRRNLTNEEVKRLAKLEAIAGASLKKYVPGSFKLSKVF